MTEDRKLVLILRLATLARRYHTYCEDSWYSCPKHPDGCANDKAGPECDCGADEINAEIDEILAEVGTTGDRKGDSDAT